MAKSNFATAFEIGKIMAKQPDKKFITKDFIHQDVSIRTIQRRLKQLEKDGKVIGDNGNPKGYKLAI